MRFVLAFLLIWIPCGIYAGVTAEFSEPLPLAGGGVLTILQIPYKQLSFCLFRFSMKTFVHASKSGVNKIINVISATVVILFGSSVNAEIIGAKTMARSVMLNDKEGHLAFGMAYAQCLHSFDFISDFEKYLDDTLYNHMYEKWPRITSKEIVSAYNTAEYRFWNKAYYNSMYDDPDKACTVQEDILDTYIERAAKRLGGVELQDGKLIRIVPYSEAPW